MSTSIASHPTLAHVNKNRALLHYFDGARVDIEVRDAVTGGDLTAIVSRADFIAAVEAELGVIVIDKAELPEVECYSGTHDLVGIGTFHGGSDPVAMRREALRYLAYAAHLKANPPLDEAKVESLESLIRDADDDEGWDDYAHLARRLLATGRIDVKGVTA